MIRLVSWFNFEYDVTTVDSWNRFIPESWCLHVLCPISCCRLLLCASAFFLTYKLVEIKETSRTIEPLFGSWWFWKLFCLFHLQLNGFTDSIGTTLDPTAALDPTSGKYYLPESCLVPDESSYSGKTNVEFELEPFYYRWCHQEAIQWRVKITLIKIILIMSYNKVFPTQRTP